jgi:hypothetical protein
MATASTKLPASNTDITTPSASFTAYFISSFIAIAITIMIELLLLAVAIRDRRDLGRKLQRQNDKRLASIGADNQTIDVLGPSVEFAEAVAAAFHLDATIDAEQRHADVATKTATRGTGERDTFSRETMFLKQADDRPLGAVTFRAGSASSGHRSSQISSR